MKEHSLLGYEILLERTNMSEEARKTSEQIQRYPFIPSQCLSAEAASGPFSFAFSVPVPCAVD